MAKSGEIEYLKKLGEGHARHATDKPFSAVEFPKYLIDLGAIARLLPPPPARLLDLGCGTGWTSWFLAKRGYEVVGQDIAPDMIAQARFNQSRYEVGPNLTFLVADYEDMDLRDEFDAALFFDSLHHAVDEESALRTAFRALRPGGVCITSEPGRGHANSPHSLYAMEHFQVTEKDMPAGHIIRLATKAGFTQFRTYAHLSQWAEQVYRRTPAPGAAGPFLRRVARSLAPRAAEWLKAALAWRNARRDDGGIVFMRKPETALPSDRPRLQSSFPPHSHCDPGVKG